MSQYFKPVRRKIGVCTLVLACVFMWAWYLVIPLTLLSAYLLLGKVPEREIGVEHIELLLAIGIALIVCGIILPVAVYLFEAERLLRPAVRTPSPDGGPLIAAGLAVIAHVVLSGFPALIMIVSGIVLLARRKNRNRD